MATVKGVWVWNQFISGDDFNQDVSFTETTLWGNMKGDNTSDGYELRYGATGGTNYVLAYSDEAGGWQRSNLVIDFGSSEQTVTDTFYTFLTANATQQAPSVPTPDWANCFVKTSAGNKAVEKVWIKQGNSLNVVWEKPVTNTVLGFTGLTNSSGALTWTDDIASLQSSAPYTTTTSGNYVSVTGALDSYFPYNQITEVEDGKGNTFIRFPKCWIKWTNDSSGNIDGFQVANYQVDSDYFIPDCFLNPNSVDGTDSYLDYVDIGKYEGSGSSSMVYSRSGYSPLVSITRANFRAGCRAYGTSANYYNGYQQLDIQTFTLYNFLCMLYYRTANIQKVYAGRTKSSNTSAEQTGSTDGVTGLNGWNTSNTCVKMLGVENPYGNIDKWCDGIFFSVDTMYIHRYPSQYSDSTTNGTTMGYTRLTSNKYVKYLRQGTANATKSAVYCSGGATSGSTYTGDSCQYSSSGTVLYVSGRWNIGSAAGLWYLEGSRAVSVAYSTLSGRLCRRPM